MAHVARPLAVVADDAPDVLRVLEHQLRNWDWQVVALADPGQLTAQMNHQPPDLLLLALRFGGHDGMELLQALLAENPDLAVVVLVPAGSTDGAVMAVKLGAFDYLSKPPDLNRLRAILGHVSERQALQKRVQRLEQLVEPTGVRDLLWGESAAQRLVRELVAGVAPTEATVLVLGERGTGKGLVARALHELSPRREGPFVAVALAGLHPAAAEALLFGYEDGSRAGCCEAADHGTLFLDEIGEMGPGLQAKLLRLLQERTFHGAGSDMPRPVDLRVIASSGRNLLARVRQGVFREDLYACLHGVRIALPPLRERREDVALLAGRFLRRAALKYRKEFTGFSPAALDLLGRYSWPGNVRQLEDLVERLVLHGRGGEVGADALPEDIRGGGFRHSPQGVEIPPRTLDEIERQAIVEALNQARGHVREAARALGLGQATVYRKVKRYGINLKTLGRTPRPVRGLDGLTA
jgi:DNA-binding NtrC family response regulator